MTGALALRVAFASLFYKRQRDGLLVLNISFWNVKLKGMSLQYQLLNPALNARADRAKYMTARPIAVQFPGYGCDRKPLTSQLNIA